MKKIIQISISLILLFSCKKDTSVPVLNFSDEERSWFIYQKGQFFTFKNVSGESIEYKVTEIKNGFITELKDPFSNPIEVAKTEYFQANLLSTTDSIVVYFYKEYQFNSSPNKMRQAIRWLNMTGQFVKLDAIENSTSFFTRVVNNTTYSNVTKATPVNETSYPWTQWKNAYYDKQYGLIELIDLKGNSWLRQ
jgi:hypothetical protein